MPGYDLSTAVRECVSCRRCFDPIVQFCPECLVELVSIELIPRLINARYRLERVLGHGSRGTTFVATDLESQQEVVVKVIRAGAIADPRAQDRFRREAQIAASLSHPAIAAVLNYGVLHDASAYITTRLAHGVSLRDELKRTGRFAPARAVAILAEIADALDAAHQAGLVHRDLKPDNILLVSAPDEDPPQIQLLDFGLARIASGRRITDESRAKGQGQIPSAPAYLSPEQFRGEEADLRSDIYSLGVIAYEMLSGRPPFVAKSFGELGAKHLAERPRPLRALNPEVNAMLEAAILKALEKETPRRYQRAAEFGRELREAIQLG
jgi:serine/threonine-protein kinase